MNGTTGDVSCSGAVALKAGNRQMQMNVTMGRCGGAGRVRARMIRWVAGAADRLIAAVEAAVEPSRRQPVSAGLSDHLLRDIGLTRHGLLGRAAAPSHECEMDGPGNTRRCDGGHRDRGE